MDRRSSYDHPKGGVSYGHIYLPYVGSKNNLLVLGLEIFDRQLLMLYLNICNPGGGKVLERS